jgi:hypothetical protein
MIDVRLPDGSTISVPTNDPKQAAAAARRHLAYRDASKTQGKYGFESMATENASLGLSRLTNAGLYAGTVGAGNAVKRLQGQKPSYGMAEAFDASRRVTGDQAAAYSKEKPVRSVFASVLGGAMMPGAKQVGGFIAGGPGAGLFGQAARAAGVGGAVGGAMGAATSDPGKELQGAKSGAMTGAVVGGVAPYAAAGAGATARTVVRGVNKATGGRLLNPTREAATRLAEAMRSDGLDENTVRAGLAEWMRTGSPTPALLDLVPQGGKTRSLLRGAAGKGGPAQRVVQKYQDRVTADLQGNAINRTRALTPGEQRPAAVVKEQLTTARQALADQEYAAPYAQQINPSPVQPALAGDAGDKGIAAALREADALSMRPEVAARLPQLRAMAEGGAQGGDLDLGSLDRIKIAMNQIGQDAIDKGQTGYGAGFLQRAGSIDDYLAGQSGDYAQARTNYAARSSGIDALDVGADGFKPQTTGFDMEAALRPLQNAPDATAMAGVGYRDAAVRGIGAPTEGATGVLNRISSSTNQGDVQSRLYGQGEAQDYQTAIGNMVDQVNSARFLNPGTGSQTAGRLFDETLVEMPSVPRGPISAIMMAVEKLRAGATLTDQEREMLLTLGTSRANMGSLDDVGAALTRRLQQGRLAATGAPIASGMMSRQSPE